ncbi:RadC family protein [Vibrio sp. WJH972]
MINEFVSEKHLLPREKLVRYGASSLSDEELLAIFLRTGSKDQNVLELSSHLLMHFGSLRQLFLAPIEEFCGFKGIGQTKYAQIQAVLELGQRYLAETLERGSALTNPNETRLYLTAFLRDRPREAFLVLFLDNQHRVIEAEILFEGTIDSASVYPREVVKRALDHNAAAIILAHNHPSGISEPSQSDRRITDKICAAMQLVDIRVLDHFVVGDGEITSFAERGWIN